MKTRSNAAWVVKITAISVAVSVTFMLVSSKALGNAGTVAAIAMLAVFVLLGIVFDVIGVSVTSASEVPFHSMAAHREPGATEAIRLIKNAEKVSSICNDVVGDIAGIISGTMSALIAARLIENLQAGEVVLQLLISGLVTGATIGGKAAGKTIAVKNSTGIVLRVGKVIHIKASLLAKR